MPETPKGCKAEFAKAATPIPHSLHPFHLGEKADEKNPFVGRDLAAFHQQLQPCKLNLLVAERGIGKTRMAAEYMNQYKDYYTGGRIWLTDGNHKTNLTAKPQLEESLAKVYYSLHQAKGWEQVSPEERKLLLHQALQNIQQADLLLIVLDDLVIYPNHQPDFLHDLIAAVRDSPGVVLLATSFQPSEGFCIVHLPALTKESALELMTQVSGRKFKLEEATELFKQTQCHTLTLELIAKYLGSHLGQRKTLQQVADLFKENMIAAKGIIDQDGLNDVTRHETGVYAGFLLYSEEIRQSPQLLVAALALCLCHYNEIPFEMWQAMAGLQEAEMETAVSSLCGFGLGRPREVVKSDATHGLIHRGLWQLRRPQDNSSKALQAIKDWLEQDQRNAFGWSAPAMGHLQVGAPPQRLPLPLEGELRLFWGKKLIKRSGPGDLTQAVAILERAAELFQSGDLKKLSLAKDRLANALRCRRQSGDLDRAIAFLQEVLELRTQVFGKISRETAASYNNLAFALVERNQDQDLTQAIVYYREAIQIDVQLKQIKHSDHAMYLNNLASALKNQDPQGNLAETISLQEQALQIDEAALGRDHPQVAIYLANLASSLGRRNQGDDLERAISYLGRVLDTIQIKQGKRHLLVAIAFNNLGKLLGQRNQPGDRDQAIVHYRQAVSIGEEVNVADHPDLAFFKYNLARALQGRGNPEAQAEAEQLLQGAKEICDLHHLPFPPR